MRADGPTSGAVSVSSAVEAGAWARTGTSESEAGGMMDGVGFQAMIWRMLMWLVSLVLGMVVPGGGLRDGGRECQTA